MSKLSFFTPVAYKTVPQSIELKLLEKVDNYFYLGGKKAYVIQGSAKTEQKEVVLCESTSSLLTRIGKVLSYFTLVVPLAMLIVKSTLRSKHSFNLIDAKQKLEEGINFSEETAAKIQLLIPKIIHRQRDEAIEWLADNYNLVFKLKEVPDVVYKMAFPGVSILIGKKLLNAKARSDNRFANMVKAQEVCLAHGLGLLRIPHAKKIEVEAGGTRYTLIAEENLDFASEESAQEALYHKYSTELNETARQLAVFVANTGFNDVTWRNIPLLNEADGFHGPRRVALIDLEHMENAANGFIGDANGSRGLIGCVSEEQIDRVIAEASKQGVTLSRAQVLDAKKRRLQKLEEDSRLRTFYANKGITTGQEPIQVDLDSLGLDLEEEGQIRVSVVDKSGKLSWEEKPVTLGKAAEDVIAEITRLIGKSPDNASIQGKRYGVLNTHEEPFMTYNWLGLPRERMITNEEEEKQLWLYRIVQALVDKGHIFKLDKVNGHGYFIQA
ncbi:DUF648 domain-containing protein [Parachlamydia sp. AcF125]|uniref:DUF648 domain-containing protein n=1 Tax=Parachlamydia sp. AcF125 TaxID=2795736 RepID=UPI001BCA17B4|nr:DUF648 domain-containing protein [Parachlamydia sp. AcF125]MBS4168176.1 hypothetical protein [Parachlamydia sp. AcF125]